jgi:hypothetical protein
MATLTIPNDFVTGQVPTASEFNANFDAVETFVNSTKLDTANLSTPYSTVCIPLTFVSVASGATEYAVFNVPASTIFVWTEVQVCFHSGSGDLSVVVTTDPAGGVGVSNVLDDPLVETTALDVATSAAFDTESSSAASKIIVAVTGSVAICNDVTVTLYAKALIRS